VVLGGDGVRRGEVDFGKTRCANPLVGWAQKRRPRTAPGPAGRKGSCTTPSLGDPPQKIPPQNRKNSKKRPVRTMAFLRKDNPPPQQTTQKKNPPFWEDFFSGEVSLAGLQNLSGHQATGPPSHFFFPGVLLLRERPPRRPISLFSFSG